MREVGEVVRVEEDARFEHGLQTLLEVAAVSARLKLVVRQEGRVFDLSSTGLGLYGFGPVARWRGLHEVGTLFAPLCRAGPDALHGNSHLDEAQQPEKAHDWDVGVDYPQDR